MENTENEERKAKFINPFTDFGFKKLFGEEMNKDLLIDFLNTLLQQHNVKIKTLTFKKTDQLGASDIDRRVVFDLYCENERGEKFIVEMQKASQTYFKDRTLYYSTFPIQEQGIKGPWNYELKSVFAIAILNFTFNDDKKDSTVAVHVKLMDTEKYKVFYDKLTFVFLQMPNFSKTEAQLVTHFDKWLYLLKNLDKFDRIPDKLKEKIFLKLFKVAAISALNKEERQKYEDSLKYLRDLENSLVTAEEKGRNEAIAELTPKIEEAQREKEEAQREKEEAQREKEEAQQREIEAQREKEEAQERTAQIQHKLIIVVKNLHNKGMSLDDIQEMTGENLETIKSIISE